MATVVWGALHCPFEVEVIPYHLTPACNTMGVIFVIFIQIDKGVEICMVANPGRNLNTRTEMNFEFTISSLK